MTTLKQTQNLHPSQHVANSDKKKSSMLWPRLPRDCVISLSHGALAILESIATSWQTWRPKKGQLWSRKKVIIMTQQKRQYGRRLRNPLLPTSVYVEGGGKVSHKLQSQQLSRKDQVSISRLRSGHHPDLKYWLHEIGRALDTVCRKCGMGKETVEHIMGECPRIHHPAAHLPEPFLNATNPRKALEL